jgi:glutamate-1-semialdehyde 2,1-aminomutase
VAAGTAAVQYYAEHPEIYAAAADGDRLTARFNEFATRHNMAVQMSNVGSCFISTFKAARFAAALISMRSPWNWRGRPF